MATNADAPSKSPPRLLPAVIVTLSVLLALKAIAFAEVAAEVAGEAADAAAAPDDPAPKKAAAKPAPDAPASCPDGFAQAAGLSPSEAQLLQSLGDRRTTLEERAAALDVRQELVAAAERRLEERLAEMKKLETRVQGLLGQADDARAQRAAGLVDVYQRMRPKDAAAVFDALDDDTLEEVASRMKQQSLAEILGKMTPERARVLTQRLAKRAGLDGSAPGLAEAPS